MPGPVFSQGNQVALCTVEENDIEFIRDTINHPEIRESVGGQSTPTNLAQERKFFDDLNQNENAIAFIITTDATACGFIELVDIDWQAGVGEIGIWIAPDHQDSGLASEALELMTEYAFNDLRLHKLTAEAYSFNTPSQHALENAGFVQEGVLRDQDYVRGTHIDVIRYGRLKPDSG